MKSDNEYILNNELEVQQMIVSKMSKSDMKTWFKMNGFRLMYKESWRTVLKYGSGCFIRNGRYYRLRNNGPGGLWVVDVSEPVADFDRWANSAEIRDIPLAKFIVEYNR